MDVESYRYVDGLWMHKVFHETNLRSVFSYMPRPDDIFIATYPKSGTTWVQYLVLSILKKGEPPETPVDFYLASPFLEMMGAEAAEKMQRPGLLKVHLPFHWTPYSADAKYICIARNPYDVCVSFYYYIKGLTPKYVKDVSFERFHELFIAGKFSWGDYFDHLLSWYRHRESQNVLFMTYEMLKKDTKRCVLKIADFLGEEYGNDLRKDPALLRRVLENCSLKNMASVFNDSMATMKKNLLNLPPEKALRSVQVLRELDIPNGGFHKNEGLIRKGLVGGWRSLFTPEQIERPKSGLRKKLDGTDVMKLWNDIDLP
uniref:Sulfotransferase domain-containing protein n=1 Tax=Amblyomma maculatum TaxID=34609 RepID=G3MPM7_AMBMU